MGEYKVSGWGFSGNIRVAPPEPKKSGTQSQSEEALRLAGEWREKSWLSTTGAVRLAVTQDGECFYRTDLVDQWLASYAADAVAAERERCAKLIEEWQGRYQFPSGTWCIYEPDDVAAAIRKIPE